MRPKYRVLVNIGNDIKAGEELEIACHTNFGIVLLKCPQAAEANVVIKGTNIVLRGVVGVLHSEVVLVT